MLGHLWLKTLHMRQPIKEFLGLLVVIYTFILCHKHIHNRYKLILRKTQLVVGSRKIRCDLNVNYWQFTLVLILSLFAQLRPLTAKNSCPKEQPYTYNFNTINLFSE